MTHIKRTAIMVCAVCLLAGLAVSSAGQRVDIKKQPPPKVSTKTKLPALDYNVSGKIGWQDYKLLAKNCGDLRVVISEQKGITNVGGLRMPKYEVIGYQYPTAMPNQSDCSYRVKLSEGKPLHLNVEWTGKFLQPVGSTTVRSSTLGWQNPITLKPGENLVRDFKMTVTEIH